MRPRHRPVPPVPDVVTAQALQLYREGTSGRAIARVLGISRNTVRRLVAGHERRRHEGVSTLPSLPPPRPSRLDEHAGTIAELLHRYPDITAQRVFEELRAKGYVGGYTMVRERVLRERPKPPVISLPTPEHGPGEMAESDWSPYTIDFRTGRRTIHVFSYVLVHSRRKAYSVHAGEDVHALMEGHVQAFQRFGGVAAACKYDNQKAVVVGREGGQPIWNLRFVDFATYYEFTPRLCRIRHPNDKPRVERGLWEFERSYLNGRSFHDVADLAARLPEWMDHIADQRVIRGEHETIAQRFAEEARHLRPLPAHVYDTARLVYRLCDAEACIAWEGNHYEVPYEHAADFLPVRITGTQVFVYARDLRCIATHDRLPKGQHGRGRLPERRPPSHGRGDCLELLRPAFADLGEPAAEFLRGLERTHPRYTAHHARKVLALRERYTTGDLVAALRHALRFGAFDSAAVARIVESSARPRTLGEYVAEATQKRLEHWLGECRTEPRDLREYDDLPCLRPAPPKEPPCHPKPDDPHLTQEPSASNPPNPRTTPNSGDDSSIPSGPSDSST